MTLCLKFDIIASEMRDELTITVSLQRKYHFCISELAVTSGCKTNLQEGVVYSFLPSFYIYASANTVKRRLCL